MKLYKEASLMMLPTSVKDGKLYSIFPQPKVISGELVTNGEFDTDSDWTKGTGWTISGGYALTDGTVNQAISQNDIATIGKKYRISFNITRLSSGTIDGRCWFGSSNPVFNFDSEGNYYFYLTANATNLRINTLSSNTASWSIDNISVVEVDQVPADFDFSRGSNLAATRINEQGLIEKGRENLLLQSNQFDTTWTDTGSEVSSGFVGYYGSSDAWKLKENTESTVHYLFQTASVTGVNTFSIYLKAGTKNKVQLYDGTNNRGAKFNLETKSVYETSGSGFIDYNIEELNDGWAKYSITGATSASSFRLYLLDDSYGISYTGDSANYIYIQDAQLEVGLVATDYIESGATTGKAGVLEDLPRLDWSGSCPTLLLEPQRANLVTYSEDFSQWTLGTGGISIDTGYLSPDGSNNATKVTMDSNFSTTALSLNIGLGTTETRTIYARTVSGTGQAHLCSFNGNTDNLFTITEEWQRFEVNGAISTGAANFYAVDFRGSTDLNEIIIWGAQAEQGSYATSYIPTHGTSVTRSADTIATKDITDIITGDSFTWFLDLGDYQGSDINTYDLYIAGSDSIRIEFRIRADGYRFYYNSIQGGSKYPVSGSTTANKFCVSYDGQNYRLYRDGVKVVTTSSVGDTGWNQFSFRNDLGAASITVLKEITLFDTSLSDNECINLTSI
jgi:hypothetical protein